MGTKRLIHERGNGFTDGFTRRFFLMSIINEIEGKNKAITDIKVSYLNSNMKDEVLMNITGKEVDNFCEVDPYLAEFVMKKGQKILYVQLDKSL